jgi:hypothetical protein
MNEEIQSNNDEAVTTSAETVQTEAPRRLFKTGSSLIAESPEMRSLSNEEIRALLKHSYPEVAHAIIRETPQTDSSLLVEFLAQPGRKG